MSPSRTIVQNAARSKEHTTLVAAVKAAGLVDLLQSKGPFTVFAPTNAAFNALPPGTVEYLLAPAQKPILVKTLSYHVVPGSYDSARFRAMIQEGNGRAVLKTVGGGTLTLTLNGASNVRVSDEKGDFADIVVYDVPQANGEIFSIDRVLIPAS